MYMLKNITQSSLEDMDNVALPLSPMMPFYSIVKDRPIRKMYEEADFITHALSIFKGVWFNGEPSTKAFSVVDSVSGYVSVPFGKF